MVPGGDFLVLLLGKMIVASLLPKSQVQAHGWRPQSQQSPVHCATLCPGETQGLDDPFQLAMHIRSTQEFSALYLTLAGTTAFGVFYD